MSDLNRADALSEALRRLKAADEAMTASAEVEARLRAEVRALGRPSHPWNRALVFGLAAAVIVCVAVPALWWRTHEQHAPAVASTQVREATTEFFPLFYGSVAASSTHVVRMEVPRAALVQFGLMSADTATLATGTVLADVIVGDDGLARAVRFVRPLSQE